MKNTGLRPRLQVSADGRGLVSRGGALLLTRTARATGLDDGPGRRAVGGPGAVAAPRAVHDPGKAVLDLAVMLAAGGDCLADAAILRAERGCSARSRPIWSSPAWSPRWPVTRPGR